MNGSIGIDETNRIKKIWIIYEQSNVYYNLAYSFSLKLVSQAYIFFSDKNSSFNSIFTGRKWIAPDVFNWGEKSDYRRVDWRWLVSHEKTSGRIT